MACVIFDTDGNVSSAEFMAGYDILDADHDMAFAVPDSDGSVSGAEVMAGFDIFDADHDTAFAVLDTAGPNHALKASPLVCKYG